MSSKPAKVKVKAPAVVMEAEVARKIRQHSRTSMKAEVCGVLIGSTGDERTLIEACIPGINAAQGGAHVTFTQDAWEHIYKIKDEQFPDEKIVGWYHSHPGFGVFLSEHDLFIQENFFSSPQQVAWVYDPHTDEEGCFGWVSGKIEKLNGLRFGYSQAIDSSGSITAQRDEENSDAIDYAVKIHDEGTRKDREPSWVKWATRVLMFVGVLGLGFVLGHQYLAWQVGRQLEDVAPMLSAWQQFAAHPVENCREILQQAGGMSGSPEQTSASPLSQSQPPGASSKQQNKTPAPAKEPNGKQ